MRDAHRVENPAGTAVRAVLFDFGGVMAEEGFQRGLARIAQTDGLDPQTFYAAAKDAVYTSGYVLGRGSEAEFWASLRGQFALSQRDAEMRDRILEAFVLRPAMFAAVRRLRARGLVCGLLSDQTDWLDRLDARSPIYAAFDRLYISYRMGMGKREARLFDAVLADLGVAPAQALFLDDAEENIGLAASRGLQAARCASEAECLAVLAVRLGHRPAEPGRER